MKSNNNSLRKKAEKYLVENSGALKNNYELGLEKIIEELNVYQIELQIQNDDLVSSNERIEQIQKKYLNLFNFSPVGFVIINTSKDILDVNNYFERFIEITKKGLVGKRFTNYIHKDYQDVFHRLIQDTIEKKEKRSRLLALVKKNQEITYYKIQSSIIYDPILEMNTITLALMDISQLVSSESTLKRQNTELKKLNSELDHFTYSTSHDLRAPLTSILGLSNLIRMSKNSPDEVENYTNMIDMSIHKLDDLIKEILQHSRNSRSNVVREPVDLKDLVNEIYNMQIDLNNKEMFNLNINVEKTAELVTDSKRLRMVFNNLISNSIRYRHSGKEVCEISVHAKIMPKMAQIVISDNGIGIHQSHIAKIFDMFYRATDDNNGSGLGLYIVKEAVVRLDGTIKVNSEIGIGTTFTISIPNYFYQYAKQVS